jgi:hypothetical protein
MRTAELMAPWTLKSLRVETIELPSRLRIWISYSVMESSSFDDGRNRLNFRDFKVNGMGAGVVANFSGGGIR